LKENIKLDPKIFFLSANRSKNIKYLLAIFTIGRIISC